MFDTSKIKLIEVYSDIAASKKGAALGIKALKESSENLSSTYFKKFLSEAIFNENDPYSEKTNFKNAKYIDKTYSVIKKLANKVKDLRHDNIFPIILAGDHSSCAGTIHGLKMAHKEDEIGVVYIDAHADIHTPYTSESGNIHGMPLAMACGIDNKKSSINNPSKEELEYWDKLKFMVSKEGSIKPENIVYCALRDFEKAEENIIKKNGINVFTVEDINYNGIKNTLENIFDKLSNCKHIYVSFDVDSIDPLYVPGTGVPVPNGLTYNQALQLNLGLIKNEKVCCWEIAEINPLYNESKNDTEKIFLMLEEVTRTLIKHY
ncbi:MAG: arginase [Arcobacter sp.]|nr:arginase [Arcobacter sp.]